MHQLRTLAAAAVISLAAVTAQASTLSNLDLELRLEKTGYHSLTIYDEHSNIKYQADFLDSQANIWGLPPVPDYLGYTIGQEYSLVATLDISQFSSDQVSNCYLGARSCSDAFGSIDEYSFWIGDGAGQTVFGDFILSGGTMVDDQVILSQFEGVKYFYQFENFSYAEWSSDLHVFSVVDNNLIPVPLPAGLPFLLAGIGGIGLMARRKRKVS